MLKAILCNKSVSRVESTLMSSFRRFEQNRLSSTMSQAVCPDQMRLINRLPHTVRRSKRNYQNSIRMRNYGSLAERNVFPP